MTTTIPQGFKVAGKDSIDTRFVLTKSEMAHLLKGDMPDNYLCMCKDDGKLYIYNSTFDKSTELGRFRPYEEILNMAQAITDALQNPAKKTQFLEAMTSAFNDEHFDIIDEKIDLAISVIEAIDGN